MLRSLMQFTYWPTNPAMTWADVKCSERGFCLELFGLVTLSSGGNFSVVTGDNVLKINRSQNAKSQQLKKKEEKEEYWIFLPFCLKAILYRPSIMVGL